MGTVGNVGFGLLILLILWILTIIIFVIAIKLQSNIGWIALAVTSSITVILLIIPTENKEKNNNHTDGDKDYLIIYKNLILSFLIISALIGLFIVFIAHCLEPIRPKSFQSFNFNEN